MRDVGRGIAETAPHLEGNARERVDGAVKFLSSIGSLAEMSEEGGKLVIKGHGCPISKAVDADVRSCKAMEALIAKLTRLPVTERCDHGARPSCRFEIKLLSGRG
jgi:predicted ArsR family transcriptional regulator